VKLSQHIAVDGSINYGQSKNDLQLAILSGSSTPQILSGSVNLHGQFDSGPYFVRPKLSVFWSHVWTSAYDLSGTLFGLPISVPFPASEFDSGIAQLSGEVSRLFTLGSGMNIMPYLEPSVQYGFLRPKGGAILTGDLKSVAPSAWSGMLRGGVRTSINTVLLEASAGYLSFGQPDPDVWEAKLRLSVGF